jgi:hypothetical protein
VISDLLKYQGLFKKAQKLYEEEEQKLNEHQEAKDRDAQYYLTMIKKGTLND